MISLFDIENGIVVPTIHCSTIKWLKVIQDKFGDKAPKIYAYIFYMSYIGEQNPYFNLKEEEKEETIPNDLGIDFSLDEPEINIAIKKATELYETPTKRLFLTLKKAVDKISDYMENSMITDGKDGNFDNFMKATTSFEKIAGAYEARLSKLKEEESVAVRGGQQMGYDL